MNPLCTKREAQRALFCFARKSAPSDAFISHFFSLDYARAYKFSAHFSTELPPTFPGVLFRIVSGAKVQKTKYPIMMWTCFSFPHLLSSANAMSEHAEYYTKAHLRYTPGPFNACFCGLQKGAGKPKKSNTQCLNRVLFARRAGILTWLAAR